MNYVSDKLKELLRKIRASKRLMYLVSVSVLVLFCLILNMAFSFLTNDFTSKGANIIINDLKYRMVINDIDLSSSVGTKLPSNTIIGDRIILLKAKKTEQFNVVLTSLNDIDTKYEIIYRICTDINCTDFIESTEDIEIAYHIDTPYVNGTIKSNNNVIVSLVSDNKTEDDYYVQLELNVGYPHNELALTNQITNDFTPLSLDGTFSIIAYVNGVEVVEFPTEPNYETGITCLYQDGSTAAARGVFRFVTGSGWEVDIFGLNQSLTTCKVDFTEILKVTYELLVNRYDCANVVSGSKPSDPLITYTGNCTLLQDNDENSDGTHKWRMKLLSSGTLNVEGLIYVDAFLVGGGNPGENSRWQSNGKGGDTILISTVGLSNKITYDVTIGDSGKNTTFYGTTATAGGNTVTAGQCEFLETVDGACKYTDNGYQGHYGAKAGQTAYGGGSNASGGDCYGGYVAASTPGATNTGGGGGEGNVYAGACNDGNGNLYGFGKNASAGGSGVVIIRDARA